jgi:ribosomal protein S18 acetylase RimI-like enzyme
VIRRATAADEPVLRELWEELEAEVPPPAGWEETWEEEWEDVRADIERGIVCLAEDGDGVIGYARASEPDKGRAHVQAVYVRPHARRQGLTKALLHDMVAALRELGAEQVSLDVLVSNQVARSVWQRLGFQDAVMTMTIPIDTLEERVAAEDGASHGAVYVQTDDAAKVEQAARRYVPRLGRSEWTEVEGPSKGWVKVRDQLADEDPAKLQRLAKELSHVTGAVVCALGVERGAAVRYVLYEHGSVVDEYLSFPELYGPLPPGDAIALGANPRVVSRLTGADPERVRAVARTASSPADLLPPDELRAALVATLGLE